MQVTNVSVKLSPQSTDRLKGFCTITLDGEFVVRDLKIIEGTNGLFIAMPSRKLTDHCPKCGGKNHLRAKFCNDCGAAVPEKRMTDEEAQSKLHADVAHPINPECRAKIQDAVVKAYHEELAREGRSDESASAPVAPSGDVGASAQPSESEHDAEPPPDADEPGSTFGQGV